MALSKEIDAVKDLVSKLDFEWYQHSISFCAIKIRLKTEDPHAAISLSDIVTFCWNRTIKDVLEKSEISYMSISLPFEITGKKIAYLVVKHIEETTDGYTSLPAIKAVVDNAIQVLKKTVVSLKAQYKDKNYHAVLGYFCTEAVAYITNKKAKLYEQIELEKATSSIDRILTVEICENIANFELEGKPLITDYRKAESSGDALFKLLTAKKSNPIELEVWISEWNTYPVYYLLIRLSEILSKPINFSAIEKLNLLFLDNDKPFKANPLQKFKSKILPNFDEKGVIKEPINAQLALIF